MTLLTIAPNQIEYDIFNAESAAFTSTKIDLGTLAISTQGIDHILSFQRYRAINQNVGNKELIGYGHVGSATYGLTEEESYELFKDDIKQTSLDLKHDLRFTNVEKLSQGEFDALMSLYYDQKQIKTLVGNAGTYDLITALEMNDANNFASILHDATDNHNKRVQDADIFRLANYVNYVTRAWLKNEGIQWLRENYPNFIASNSFNIVEQRTQAKVSYYRGITKFFKDTTESENLKTKQIVDAIAADTRLNVIQ